MIGRASILADLVSSRALVALAVISVGAETRFPLADMVTVYFPAAPEATSIGTYAQYDPFLITIGSFTWNNRFCLLVLIEPTPLASATWTVTGTSFAAIIGFPDASCSCAITYAVVDLN